MNDSTTNLIAAKHMLYGIPYGDTSYLIARLLDEVYLDMEIPTEDFLETILHGTALELLELLYHGEGSAHERLYDLAKEIVESYEEPDDESLTPGEHIASFNG